MKIHKINLENYYINAFYLAICRRFNAPDSAFPSKPEYNEVLIRVKPGEKAMVALPVMDSSARFEHSNVTAPVWLAPYMPKTGLLNIIFQYNGGITPSITGVEFKTETISLGKLELYENTRWQGQLLVDQTGKLAELQPGNTYNVTLTGRIGYTTVRKVGRQNQQVWVDLVTFNNTTIMKITVKEESDNGPDTIIDAEPVDLNALVARVEALEEAAANAGNE
jgi:hypothetical protein